MGSVYLVGRGRQSSTTPTTVVVGDESSAYDDVADESSAIKSAATNVRWKVRIMIMGGV